jgi:hypothetical protein
MGFQFAAPRRQTARPAPSAYRQLSAPASLPPPVGGWNKRDALPSMPPSDAVRLDNWIPDTASVRLRKGYASWATGMTNAVESLMEYAPPTGSNKLFAATSNTIWDATASGAASSVTTTSNGSLSNGRWQHAQFANTTGNYLYLCNGADTPRYYDGSVWTNSTFAGSGLTIANLIGVISHMNRLWFIEKNTLNAWYGGTSSISGTLTKFLPPFKLGGSLLAMASWSRDGGSGPDDNLVFLSTKGEAAVYAGTDPASASTSALIGVFKLPEPIGRRCFLPIGSDLGVLTSQGIVPFSAVLGQSASGAGRSAITNKIVGAFRESYLSAATNFGWQLIEYPKQNLLIANVPVAERTRQYQYVMNTNTGSWCRFTGINAGCWSLLGDVLYFGGNAGVVYKYDTDYLDDTTAVTATVQTAYSTFGTPANKLFTMARPLFLSPPSYTPLVSVLTDYDTSAPNLAVVSAIDSGTSWDVGPWDTSAWAASEVPSLPWESVQGLGMAGSIAFAVSAQSELVFNGVDVVFEAGGLL